MMSSPSYNMSDHTNGLSSDQYSSSFISANSNINGNNSKNGASMSSESMNTVKFDNEIDNKMTNMLASNVSTLPASSTTSTVSTSSSSNATFTSNNGNDDVCRDYLRNVCRRGKSCRFKHPDPSENDLSDRKDVFVFCHDFQNRECRRENCRFMHCTKQEEEIFRSTGKLPQNILTQMGDDSKNNSTPICKDFTNGICRRAPGRCKFRHPSTDTFQQAPSTNRNSFEGRNGQRGSNYAMCSPNSHNNLDFQAPYGRQHGAVASGSNIMPSNYGYNDNYAENPNKRKRGYDSMYNSNNGPYTATFNDPLSQVHGYSMPSSSHQYYGARSQMEPRSYLEEENIALRHRIDELKKQVTELITTNDFLMEQINQLRVQSAGGPAAAVAVATATSVASLVANPPPGIVSSTATALGISSQLSQSLNLQAQVGPPPPPPPPPTATVIGIPAPPSSIVSSITSITLPTVTTPVSLVNSSGAASLVSYTPSISLHSSNPWSLGVDQ